MKISNVVLSALLGFAACPLFAADSSGRYFIGGGVGAVSCPDFVATMERARQEGVGTVRFAEETQGFTMFILGFQTGYNAYVPDTYDIFPAPGSEYPLLSWVENYCRANPLSNFAKGVVAMARDAHPRRQRAQPAKDVSK